VRRSLLIALVVVGLVALAPLMATAAPANTHPEWGTTSARNATVKQGCRSYPYSYALTPPDGDWALETFLVGPRGKQYGAGYFDTGADPLAGEGAWRLCRRSTRGGQYTIRARLTVQNGGDYYDGWLPETTFSLHEPRRPGRVVATAGQ
jgi:hypothetical protein